MIDISQKQEYIRLNVLEASKQQLNSLDFKEQLFNTYKYESIKFVKEKSKPKISEEILNLNNAPSDMFFEPGISVPVFEFYYAISGLADEIVKLSQSADFIKHNVSYKKENNQSYFVFSRYCNSSIEDDDPLIAELRAETLRISNLIEDVIAAYNTEINIVNNNLRKFIEDEVTQEYNGRKHNDDILSKLNPFI